MQQANIKGLGEIGLSFDLPPWSIPDNAWSRGKNVRAYHGRMRNFGGRTLNTTAPIELYGLVGFQTPTRETIWIEAGLAAVYAYDGTNHINLTRLSGPYTMNEYVDRWTGGVQGSLGFLCDGFADGPQQWTTIDTTVRLIDMAYDPAGAPGFQTWEELGYKAYAMRSFAGTIMAMNIRRQNTALPSTIQWCDFLSPGATQTNWVAGPAATAGEKALGETSGAIIDGQILRDDFIVYKEDSAYRGAFTGDASSPFIFTPLPEYVRLVNRGCIGVGEEFHILASRDDVHIFDGNTFRSLLEHRMREYYRDTMFPERLFTTFVSVLNKEQEVWICFPSQGNVGELKFPDRAIVWNYHDNTLSLTDLPQVRDMDEGVIVPDIDDTFDSIIPSDLSFDQDFNRFDESPFATSLDFMVGAHGTSLSVFGESPTDDGVARECIAERTGLILQDQSSGLRSIEASNRMREVRVHLEATSPIQIQFGGQTTPTGPVTWGTIHTFDPATQYHLNTRTMFKYFAYRILSNSPVEWSITRIEAAYKQVRRR